MSLLRTLLRTSLRTPRPAQFTRRYASQSSKSNKTSEMPMLVLSAPLTKLFANLHSAVAVATVTAAGGYYLLQSGPESKLHHETDQYAKGEAIESGSKASESTPQPDRDSEQKVSPSGSSGGGSLGQPPSNVDPVRSYPDFFCS